MPTDEKFSLADTVRQAEEKLGVLTVRNLVVGTAGHVDHGKTALVKLLTGIDTDQLREETEQGISIVPGFAHLRLASGQVLEMVDVPGHEKLIKNMYRGISGVDIVLLAIAADDGPMPQTREHLNILDLIEIKAGLVAITKVDLVDDELLMLVTEEVKTTLEGTFLKNAPIVYVSNKTGQGLDEIKANLEKLAGQFREKADERAFRLPIDRVFVIPGHGSVATGTVASGKIRENDEVEIFPSNEMTKIRAIQVHNDRADEAIAGQRVGLNLSNVGLNSIKRGMVLSEPRVLAPSHLINASLHYLESNKKVLPDRTKVRLHLGTSEAIARIVLMDGAEILPGQTKYVQLRLDRELVPLPFDKYIIRSLSPTTTIGGGTILEIAHKKYRAYETDTIRYLEVLENGSPVDSVASIVKRGKYKSVNLEELLQQSGLSRNECLEAIGELKSRGKLIQIGKEAILHRDVLKYLKKRVVEVIRACYENNPLQRNLPRNKVRNLVEESLSPQIFELVVQELTGEQIVEIRKEELRLKSSNSRLTAKEQRIVRELDRMCTNLGFKPVRFGVLVETLDFCREKDIAAILKFQVSEGKLVRLKDGSFMEAAKYQRAEQMIVEFTRDNKKATTVQIRDLLESGRRGAISILEHLDSLKLTTRIDDYRILRKS